MGRKKRKRLLAAHELAAKQQFKPTVITTIPVNNGVKAMITKTIKQTKEFQGMMTCILEHTVTETRANYEWSGPKISPAVWSEVLAFFKWTHTTTQSECQVRLYCNYRTREWKAWAFPQRKGTGMTTKELDDHPQTAIQRAQFSDQDGWFYYGTVHHHCSASAFQSGVDESNENNQEGLHITVGFMDRPQHDIDARLYHARTKITNMQLGWFWDVGNPTEGLPPHVIAMLPPTYKENFAKLQMGTAAPADFPFPEVWKENLIAATVSTHVHTTHYHGTVASYYRRTTLRPWSTRSLNIVDWDVKGGMSDLKELLTYYKEPDLLTMLDCLQIYKDLAAGPVHLKQAHFNLLDVMVKNDLNLEKMIMNIELFLIDEEEAEAELALEMALGKVGTPPGKAEKIGKKNKAAKGLAPLPDMPRRDMEDHEVNGADQTRMEFEGGAYPGYGQGYGMGG